MAIRCEHVHRLELRKFFKFCVAHSPVRGAARISQRGARICAITLQPRSGCPARRDRDLGGSGANANPLPP